VLLGITLVFMVGNSSDAFLILRSKDLGLTTTLVVLAYVAYNVVYAALSYPAGVISDRLPRSWVLATGWAVFAVVYAGFALTNSSGAVWPLFLVYGGYIALTDGVSKALVADIVPEAVRSSALGLYQGLAGLAALSASIMAGLMWDYVSESAPFVLGGVCALAAAVALVIVTMGGIFSEKQPATAVAG
jgi:MFS family permease